MSQDHFVKALQNFTMDAACGDAIRHLCDKGYTLDKVKETLTFPAPTEYVAKIMWDRCIETRKIIESTGTVLSDSDSSQVSTGHLHEIVEMRDRYGRKSFVRVQKESPEEMIFSPEDYVQYENLFILKNAQEQVFSLSHHIPLKDRSTGSHRDM